MLAVCRTRGISYMRSFVLNCVVRRELQECRVDLLHRTQSSACKPPWVFQRSEKTGCVLAGWDEMIDWFPILEAVMILKMIGCFQFWNQSWFYNYIQLAGTPCGHWDAIWRVPMQEGLLHYRSAATSIARTHMFYSETNCSREQEPGSYTPWMQRSARMQRSAAGLKCRQAGNVHVT